MSIRELSYRHARLRDANDVRDREKWRQPQVSLDESLVLADGLNQHEEMPRNVYSLELLTYINVDVWNERIVGLILNAYTI